MSQDEQDLNIIFQEISSIISRNIYNVTGEKKKQLLNRTESYIAEAQDIVNKMKRDSRNDNSNQLDNKIKSAQNNINKFKSLLSQERRNLRVNERTQLLGDSSGSFDYNISDMDQRTRLLYNTQRIYDMNSRFEGTQRLAEEAESVGSDTLQSLLQQRQQIVRTNNSLNETQDGIGISGRYLVAIQKNEKIMKLLFILLVVIILVVIGLAIYLKIHNLLK